MLIKESVRETSQCNTITVKNINSTCFEKMGCAQKVAIITETLIWDVSLTIFKNAKFQDSTMRFFFKTCQALALSMMFTLIKYALTLCPLLKLRGSFYVLAVSWQPVWKPQPWSAAAGKRLATRHHCAPAAFPCNGGKFSALAGKRSFIGWFHHDNSWMKTYVCAFSLMSAEMLSWLLHAAAQAALNEAATDETRFK